MVPTTLTKKSLDNAYQYCQNIARTHYENFPVASFLLPKDLRKSVAVIYAFARTADDIADEGDLCTETRLLQMTKFESNLYDIQYGKPPTDPIFIALKDVIERFQLPIKLFYDLLSAFRQDILKNSYQNFVELKDYCQYSANPVGRLLLHLTGHASHANLLLSDDICTGLQLLNFLQDIQIDIIDKQRCYLPQDELEEYGVDLANIVHSEATENYRALITKQLQRATAIFNQGIPLGNNLPGLFGLEIRFIIASGLRLIRKLEKRADIFMRPKVHKFDMLSIFFKNVVFKNNLPEDKPFVNPKFSDSDMRTNRI